MRIPFLRPRPEATPAKPARARGQPPIDDVADVEAARTQARRRLVGALVLLLIGVVGFPILFETQPRPLPMDTPFEVARRDTAGRGAVVTESASGRPGVVSMPPADAGNEVPPLVAPAAASRPLVPAAASASTPPSAWRAASAVAAGASRAAGLATPAAAAPASSPLPASRITPAAGVTVSTARTASAPAAPAAPTLLTPAPARAIAQAQAIPAAPSIRTPPMPPMPSTPPAPASASAPAAGRFVVQAGAYSDADKLREARSRIERLGLKTYTQVIEGDKGSRTRVRVGPFDSRAEAEAVAEKIKRGGVPSAILAL